MFGYKNTRSKRNGYGITNKADLLDILETNSLAFFNRLPNNGSISKSIIE